MHTPSAFNIHPSRVILSHRAIRSFYDARLHACTFALCFLSSSLFSSIQLVARLLPVNGCAVPDQQRQLVFLKISRLFICCILEMDQCFRVRCAGVPVEYLSVVYLVPFGQQIRTIVRVSGILKVLNIRVLSTTQLHGILERRSTTTYCALDAIFVVSDLAPTDTWRGGRKVAGCAPATAARRFLPCFMVQVRVHTRHKRPTNTVAGRPA